MSGGQHIMIKCMCKLGNDHHDKFSSHLSSYIGTESYFQF